MRHPSLLPFIISIVTAVILAAAANAAHTEVYGHSISYGRVVDSYKETTHKEAAECHAAKQKLLDAQTGEEVDNDLKIVHAVCDT